MKILIVEDNPTVRKLIRYATADLATEIVEREDGSEALDAYEAHHPDVVLMDVSHGTHGWANCNPVAYKQHPSARVIIVTDYWHDELRRAATEAGAYAFASKKNLTDLETIVSAACAA